MLLQVFFYGYTALNWVYGSSLLNMSAMQTMKEIPKNEYLLQILSFRLEY